MASLGSLQGNYPTRDMDDALNPALARLSDDKETTAAHALFLTWARMDKPNLAAACRHHDIPYGTAKKWRVKFCWQQRRSLWIRDLQLMDDRRRRDEEERQATLAEVKTEAHNRIEAVSTRSRHLEAVAQLATARAEQLLQQQMAGDPQALKQSAAGIAQLMQAATKATESVLRDAAFSEELRGVVYLVEELEEEERKGSGRASSWQSSRS